jgi:predicted dehydrogenase
MDRVRLAVIGCGNICQLNVPGYLEHPRCDVVALCDTDKTRADARARQWGITPRIYTDYTELLGDPEVDAVELLTPTYLHADQIVAALAAGKHVSCQKPIAVSVAEVDRIAAAVARARTTFRVTENFLYYPPIVKAKELLDAGVIGEPSLVRIHTTRAKEIVGSTLPLDPEALVWRRDPRRNPGGALYDDGVHKYATAMYWIGNIGEISALVGRSADFLQETPSVAHFRFKGSDCLGIIDYTYAPDMPIRSRYARTSSSRSTARAASSGSPAAPARCSICRRSCSSRAPRPPATRCPWTGAPASTAPRAISSMDCWRADSLPKMSARRRRCSRCPSRSTRRRERAGPWLRNR